MEFNDMRQSLLKEEWIDNVKYMTPRPRYNHIELQGELYLQLKNYFKKFGSPRRSAGCRRLNTLTEKVMEIAVRHLESV